MGGDYKEISSKITTLQHLLFHLMLELAEGYTTWDNSFPHGLSKFGSFILQNFSKSIISLLLDEISIIMHYKTVWLGMEFLDLK